MSKDQQTTDKRLSAKLYPADLKLIDTVETLKVVADPLRLRILAALRRGSATAKELAHALGTPLKGLYYHLALLEEHDLIRVAATRVVSGIIEKQYAVTAYRLSVERSLFAPEAPDPQTGLDVFLSVVLDHAHAEIQRSVAAGLIDLAAPTHREGGVDLGRLWMRLTPAQRDELEGRQKALFLEYAEQQAAPDDPEARYYEFLLGSYPVIAPPDGGQEQAP
jgi:DNA-binding transcriptional ArsR family regulator